MTLYQYKTEMIEALSRPSDYVSPVARYRDPHLASSLLQKALRRGDERYAVGAATSLALLDPARLWRRLSAIVIEDFGRADLSLTAKVIAAASDGRWRDEIGGDALVASYLVKELCATPRDRVVDELYMWAAVLRLDAHPAVPLGAQPLSPRLRKLVSEAIHVSLKCETLQEDMPDTRYWARLCDATLADMCRRGQIDPELYSLALAARRCSKTPLPLYLGLLTRHRPASADVETCCVPAFEEVRGVPTYAVDGYTRPGREALWRLLKVAPALAQLLDGLRGARTLHAMTALLFETEGGLLTRRIKCPLTEELRSAALGSWSGLDRQRFDAGLEIMRGLLPELNVLRRQAMGAI
jgi:hypothetical protein